MATALAPLTQQAVTATEGLPMHPLVVHVAVVLLPLALIGLVCAVLVPRLRSRLAAVSLLGLAVATAAAWAAEESGESLADRVGVSPTHARFGELVPVAAFAALAAAAVWWRLERGPAIAKLPPWSQRAAGVAVLVTAVLATGLTILTGHSGAVSVWAADTPAPAGLAAAVASPSAAGSPTDGSAGASPGDGAGGYTLADVAGHNTRTDCWSVVGGTVYDLTSWIAQHPGGQGVITGMCGVDATAAFRGQHGDGGTAVDALTGFALGPVAADGAADPSASPSASAPPSAARPPEEERFTRAEVARHDRTSDCWSVVDGKVYDLTQWVSRHPGGREGIAEMCGSNGGGEFLEEHAGDAAAEQVLAGYQIGVLE